MSAIDSSIPLCWRNGPGNSRMRARTRSSTTRSTLPGIPKALTWSQVHRRAQVVAAELASCGSPGDRVAILAPQGLEYIVGFLGAMEAGFVAVPLSVPLFGAHDERVSAALKDSSPAAVLTTSAVVNDVDSCAHGLPGSPPAVIEIDALDLYTPPAFHSTDTPQTKTAMLQYTSGSTRQPTGVVVTHKNVFANLDPPGSIPITTSGKVRRSACAERYRQDEFTRLDTPA